MRGEDSARPLVLPQGRPAATGVRGWPPFPRLFSGAVRSLRSLPALKVVPVLRRGLQRVKVGETGGGTGQGVEGKLGRVVTGPLPLACCLRRALSGRLRLGLAEQSVLAALSQAVSLTPPGQGEAPRWSRHPALELTRPTARLSPSPRPHSSLGSFPGSLVSIPCFPYHARCALGVAEGSACPKASADASGLRIPSGRRGCWEGQDSRGPKDVAGGASHDPEADILVRSGAVGRVGGPARGGAQHRGPRVTSAGPVAGKR